MTAEQFAAWGGPSLVNHTALVGEAPFLAELAERLLARLAPQHVARQPDLHAVKAAGSVACFIYMSAGAIPLPLFNTVFFEDGVQMLSRVLTDGNLCCIGLTCAFDGPHSIVIRPYTVPLPA